VQSRARLVEAAREVFERDGFLNARISDIAAAAGMAQGSFYHYFDSKEQIFREVAEEQERRLTAPPDEPPSADDDDSVEATVERSNRRYLERYRDAARLMGVIEEVSRYDEHVNAARMATQQHYWEYAEETIRDLQAKGLVDERLNPTITAEALGVMMNRFAELWLVQGYREYDFDEAVEQLTMLCMNALGAPRPTRRAGTRGRGGSPNGR
jgi:AcrR family transcriptional regulator